MIIEEKKDTFSKFQGVGTSGKKPPTNMHFWKKEGGTFVRCLAVRQC